MCFGRVYGRCRLALSASSRLMHSAFLAMLDCTVFLTSDFPAVALVVCSEEKVAHGFDHLSHRSRSQEAAGECGV
jgi:hypothetical protein